MEYGAELPKDFQLDEPDQPEFGADLPEGFTVDAGDAPKSNVPTPSFRPDTEIAAPEPAPTPEVAQPAPEQPVTPEVATEVAKQEALDLGTFMNAALKTGGPQNARLIGNTVGAFSDLEGGDETLDRYSTAIVDIGNKAEKGIAANRVINRDDISSIWDIDDYIVNAAGEMVGSQVVPMAGGIAGGFMGGRLMPGKAKYLGIALGAGGGAFAGSNAMNIGSMRETLIEEGVTDRQMRGKWSIIGGGAMSTLDFIMPKGVSEKVLGEVKQTMAKRIAKRLLSGAWKGAVTEGTTEALQESLQYGIGKYVSGNEVDLDELADIAIESGLKGAIGGGFIQGATDALTPSQRGEAEESALAGRDQTLDTPPQETTVATGEGPTQQPQSTVSSPAAGDSTSPSIPQTTQVETESPASGPSRPSPATPEEEQLLTGAGFTLGDVYEMSPEQVAENVQVARDQGVEPGPAIPATEPARDVYAQLADMQDGSRPRKGVYIAPGTVEHMRDRGLLDGALEYGEVVENVDGNGGIAIVEDKETADKLTADIAGGRSFEEAIGELTNSGTGKPEGATDVVRQIDTETGAVTQERVVAPQDIPATVEELKEDGREVDVVGSDEAIAAREARVQEEAAELPDGFTLDETQREEVGPAARTDEADRGGAETQAETEVAPEEASSEETGTAKAPAKVETKEQLDQAGAQVDTEPTEAQKEAGNYKKGHVKWQGLDVTVENPEGSTRSGTDANGERWEVKMPKPYGYIKRTEGADGDQVDITLVDPASSEVTIIDQKDLTTGKFDESKVFGGANAETARQVYNDSFSDGRAEDRIGAVTTISIDEFKDWLKNGDTRKPYGALEDLAPDTATPSPILDTGISEGGNTNEQGASSPEPTDAAGERTSETDSGTDQEESVSQGTPATATQEEPVQETGPRLTEQQEQDIAWLNEQGREDISEQIERHAGRGDLDRLNRTIVETLQAAADAGGSWPRINPYGVYDKADVKKGDKWTLPFKKRNWKGGPEAEIAVLEAAPGRWVEAYDYNTPTSGGGGGLSISVHYPTRQEAIDTAVARMRKSVQLRPNDSAEGKTTVAAKKRISAWLDENFGGEADNVIEAEAEAVTAPVSAESTSKPKTQSLLPFLKSLGGIKNEGGELTARELHKRLPGVVNNKTGLSLDEARQRAVDAGYLDDIGQITGAESESDINQLLSAIDDELGGNKRFSREDAAQVEEDRLAQEAEDSAEFMEANFSEKEIAWLDKFDTVDMMRLIDGAREIDIDLNHYKDADIARMLSLVSEGQDVDTAIEQALIYDPDPESPTDAESFSELPFDESGTPAESSSAGEEAGAQATADGQSTEFPDLGEAEIPPAGQDGLRSDEQVRQNSLQRVLDEYGEITPENWTQKLDDNDGRLYIRDHVTTGGKLWELIGGPPSRSERQRVSEILPIGTRFRDAGMAVDGRVMGYNDDGAQVVVRYFNASDTSVPREKQKLARKGQEAYPVFFVRDGRVIHDSIMDISEVKPVQLQVDDVPMPGQASTQRGIRGNAVPTTREEFMEQALKSDMNRFWGPDGMLYKISGQTKGGYEVGMWKGPEGKFQEIAPTKRGEKWTQEEAAEKAAEAAGFGATPLEDIGVSVEADVVDGTPGETETIQVSAAEAQKKIDQRLNGLFALKKCVLS